MSTNFRMRNPLEGYSNILVQAYLVYTEIPYKTVFFLKIHTNIDWYKNTKQGFHYYSGTDLSYFRYPDKELLDKGLPLSAREFEIVSLAEQLFLSVNTVYTHRNNILLKTGKENISDLIISYKEEGLM